MANFATTGQQTTLTTTYKTIVTALAASSSPHRGKVYDLLIGTAGTPADNVLQYDISRITADGTGTAFTPNPLDPADAACTATSKYNHTIEPTYAGSVTSSISTSSLFMVGINQRASYRWVAAPGSELVWPATASNGVGLRALSPAYTGTTTGTLYFCEQ